MTEEFHDYRVQLVTVEAYGVQAACKVRVLSFASTGNAYDACNYDESIKTGDVLVIRSEKVVGLADAWPVAVTVKHGNLHTLKPGANFTQYQDGAFIFHSHTATAVALALGYPVNPDTL